MYANCTAVVVDHHWSRRLANNADCGVTPASALRLADQAVPSQTKSCGNGIELGSSGKPGTASASGATGTTTGGIAGMAPAAGIGTTGTGSAGEGGRTSAASATGAASTGGSGGAGAGGTTAAESPGGAAGSGAASTGATGEGGGGAVSAASAMGAPAAGGGGGTTAATGAGSGAAKFVKPARRLVRGAGGSGAPYSGALSAQAAVCSDSGMAEGAAKFSTMSRQGHTRTGRGLGRDGSAQHENKPQQPTVVKARRFVVRDLVFLDFADGHGH